MQPEASATGRLGSEVGDAEMQLIEQDKMLLQLKDVIRECEQSLAAKDEELQVCKSFRCTTVTF